MDLFLQVLQVVAPVFLLASIGAIWSKLGLDYNVQFVTRLTMTLSIPALIFVALVETQIDPQALRDTAVASAGAYLGVAAVFWGMLRVLNLEIRTFLAPLVFGNTGNLGLPLALFAFGEAGLDYAVVVFAIMAILSFTVGVWIVSGGGSVVTAFKEPVVWATILGGIFLVNGWTLPRWSMNTLDLLGQIAIPLMLITLGVAVSRLRPDSLGRAVWLSAVKYIICITIPLGIGFGIGLEPLALAVMTVQISTPVAVTSYMLAEKYDANSGEVAGLVVVSTAMSIIVIPVLLAFLL